MTEPVFYVDGEFIPQSKAKLPIEDLGLIRGYGVFTTVRTYGGKPFRLPQHIRRIFRSAKLINLHPPASSHKLTLAVRQTIRKNAFPETVIRIIFTGGRSDADGLTPIERPTLIILAFPLEPLHEKLYREAASIITARGQRFLPEAKSLNYLPSMLGWQKAQIVGAIEAVICENGDVLECGTSNIFLVKSGRLITPKEDILFGITRAEVMKLARRSHIPVQERQVKKSELYTADEVFLTSTTKEILPIVKVDRKRIGIGKPGPITLKLLSAFREITLPKKKKSRKLALVRV